MKLIDKIKLRWVVANKTYGRRWVVGTWSDEAEAEEAVLVLIYATNSAEKHYLPRLVLWRKRKVLGGGGVRVEVQVLHSELHDSFCLRKMLYAITGF